MTSIDELETDATTPFPSELNKSLSNTLAFEYVFLIYQGVHPDIMKATEAPSGTSKNIAIQEPLMLLLVLGFLMMNANIIKFEK
ncbi:MAG: hypothetical protein DRP42_02475 [Tenericutes bacterium]|nr:MAG: hypothetical protein DRP42_02475 [Mycoplasmatota bacterium]